MPGNASRMKMENQVEIQNCEVEVNYALLCVSKRYVVHHAISGD